MALTGLVGAASALALLVAGAPPPTTVTTGLFRTFLKAYDPTDELDLPGDTHLLELDVSTHQVAVAMEHFTCGPQDPVAWPVDGCARGGGTEFAADKPRLDYLADNTIRVRVATPVGFLDVTMTGTAEAPFRSYDRRTTVGTRQETSVGVTRNALPPTTVAATLDGVALRQPAAFASEAHLQTTRTTTAVATVPAVPVPALPPPGTRTGDVVTEGAGSVFWSRRLPSRGPRGTLDVELGRIWYEQRDFPAWVSAEVQRQRCRPGQRLRPPLGAMPANPCAVLGAKFGAESYNAVVDVRNARLHAVIDLAKSGGLPRFRVDLTWRGRGPLGVREVEQQRGAVEQNWFHWDRSGIRWSTLTVTGTIGGKAPNRLWNADFTVHDERITREPATPE